jgi:iron(III) transport system ATP-binding protein
MADDVLECRDLTVAYDGPPVLRLRHLRVARGEMVAVLGPSGSGKTTLLHAVAGFVAPRAGEIVIDGRQVEGGRRVPPERRRLGVVFQHAGLWPHLSAEETVAYPLRRRGVRPAEAAMRARDLLERMGIDHLAGRRPAELSGGQQQRVGLARALACQAALYLFDEPTAHLDTALRSALQHEVAAQRRASGAAALYATHDAAEALAIADRVVILRDGEAVQAGSPEQIYEQPVDLWAARLTGPASVLAGRVDELAGGRCLLVLAGEVVEIEADAPAGVARPGPVGVLLRPDWTELGGPLPGVVDEVWYRGPHTDYALATPAGTVTVRRTGPPATRAGERVTWAVQRAWLLPAPADLPKGTPAAPRTATHSLRSEM